MDELKTIVQGQVLTDEKSLEHYSYDGSIFSIRPSAIVLPKDKLDIKNLVKWSSQKMGETNDPRFSLVGRGKGTDQAGGALGPGILIRFPGFLDKVIEIGKDFCRVEPGVIFGELNRALKSLNRFIPSFPASADFSTLGGAVANNAAGEKTAKYGSTRNYVQSLKIILSSGDEIETKPLNASELSAKKSQDDFEGEIYRQMDQSIENNCELISQSRPQTTKNSSGYALWDIKKSDGSFDLTQLFIGSQGTLGIISEITLKTILLPETQSLVLGYFDTLEKLGQAVEAIVPLGPSAAEMVDHYFLKIVQVASPELLEGLLPQQFPQYILLVEFDGLSDDVKSGLAKAEAILKLLAYEVRVADTIKEQQKLWKLRHSAAAVIIEKLKGPAKALPFVEDCTVKPQYLAEYLADLSNIASRYKMEVPVWGHAADGDLHFQPLLNLDNEDDRVKVFSLAHEIFTMVKKYKGSLSGEHNDGLFRTPYLDLAFGSAMVDLFFQTKKIFDPVGIFNPYKKVSRDLDILKKYLRREYNMH